MVQRGGVELHELDVGDHRAGPEGERDAVAGGDHRVRRDLEQLAHAAGRDDRVVSTDLHRRTRGIQRPHPDAPAALDHQIHREAAFPNVDEIQRVNRGNECPLDLGPGGVAARVHDA